jgi:long-chain acyl-CoA synthetase
VMLGDLLLRLDAIADPNEPLVYAGDRVATWGDVRARATDVAGALADAGVAAGHAVGVMLPNGVDVIATLFGVWQAGAVYVPLNPRLADDEVARVLADVRPAAVVTADGIGTTDGEPRRYGDDVALVQYTSGTTGRPKPVPLTHDGVAQLLDSVVAKLRPAPAAGPTPQPKAAMPNLIPVSLSLWAGIYNVLFAFRVGAAVVLMARFDPPEFARLVAKYEIRSSVLPPAALVMLVDDERVQTLAPLKYVRSITAPLSPLQARRFRDRFGIAVLNSYGQTELGGEIVGWTAADSRAHGETKLGSVGRPHAGVELRVVAVGDGAVVTDLPVDGAGELWVRTSAIGARHGDGSDLGERLSPDGWFRTGDVARIDADGFVWIEGRVSDVINRGGLKVYPAEVEEVLRTAPEVADAAVVGVPDDRLGEVPWAFVVASGELAAVSDALSGLCRDHLAPYKVPVRFEVIDDLPRNEVGKVLKGMLIGRAQLPEQGSPR